jgi:predicted HTH domain antitoxin
MSLNVNLDWPADLEEKLRREHPNLAAEVKEAYALELFRRGKLSHYELSRVLGLDRLETDAWLQRRQVYEGSPSMNDLESDRQTLHRLMDQAGR